MSRVLVHRADRRPLTRTSFSVIFVTVYGGVAALVIGGVATALSAVF